MAEFTIYELPLLRGTLALSPLPGRTRHYATDLVRLLAWKPGLVVTMCEAFELERKGAGSLGADMSAYGIAWRYLPVQDFGVPAPDGPPGWSETSALAQHLLGQGNKVLVHCFGGCGRSGMAALRLMIEAGEERGAALHRLRSVRPSAVETEAQLSWSLGAVG